MTRDGAAPADISETNTPPVGRPVSLFLKLAQILQEPMPVPIGANSWAPGFGAVKEYIEHRTQYRAEIVPAFAPVATFFQNRCLNLVWRQIIEISPAEQNLAYILAGFDVQHVEQSLAAGDILT
ncbi:hypothetical protein NS319_01150 [Sphingomonas sanguinis]|uniref:Uncharacterized protein n=1 Tax=Sphingomonas sanguinis TaxID=33051 RepID=A0A147I7I5_9SPHN|nr:hypothetical protein NS319_01150 [Sphingomonas sanguinis]